MKRVALAPDLAHGIAARLAWRSALALLACTAAACPLRAQFTLQDSGSSADLRGIVNVGNGTAWASGTHGTVLRTEDSGFVWQGCAVPPGAEQLDFRGIQAVDDQTAIVMSSGKGDLSRVYKTTDGCKSWKLVFTNPDVDGFFDGMSIFWPRTNEIGQHVDANYAQGLLFGDPVAGIFPLFETKDGGASWNRRERSVGRDGSCTVDLFQAAPGEAAFAASNQALLSIGFSTPLFVSGGSRARVAYGSLFSFDGALCHDSTHSVALPLAQGSPSAGAFAIAVSLPLGNGEGLDGPMVVVGGDYKKPDEVTGTAATISHLRLFFRSIRPAKTPPHGYRSSVAYDAKAKAWITVGPNGTDVSTDDGRNWRALKPGYGDDPSADKQWNALSLPYVVGPHGRIGRLRDDALAPGK